MMSQLANNLKVMKLRLPLVDIKYNAGTLWSHIIARGPHTMAKTITVRSVTRSYSLSLHLINNYVTLLHQSADC